MSYTSMGNRRKVVYASPTMVCELEMDRRGMARVAVGHELASAVRQVVRERALPYAISISPVSGSDHPGRPHYIESFHITEGHTVIAGMRRVVARLVNVAPHAAAVEFTGKNPHASGHRVLGKTVDHLNAHGGKQGRPKAPWRPDLHPRGPGGKFAPKN